MSSVNRVPETALMSGGELTMDHARTTLRHYGGRQLLWESFRRFRYGDGFTSARALGFQVTLTTIPLSIAFVGLSTSVQQDGLAQALQQVILSVTPGDNDQVVRTTLMDALAQGRTGGIVALVVGLLVALLALTTAMGQVERGANRIYGIQRDRPARHKYARAALLALAAGIPAATGFVILIAGGVASGALATSYGWEDTTEQALRIARWPVGVLLVVVTLTVVFRWAPRRRQPGYSWLAVGASVSLVLWLTFSGLLALYVATASSFNEVYGPLTAVMALLLWAQLSSIALFLGIAFAAQLEAARAGVRHGAGPDHDPDTEGDEATASPRELVTSAVGRVVDEVRALRS